MAAAEWFDTWIWAASPLAATAVTGTDWITPEMLALQEYIISAWTSAAKNILPAPRSSNDIQAPKSKSFVAPNSYFDRIFQPKTGKKSLPKPPSILNLF
jgi:hypothetical protein